jgi:hypothetical protein
MKNWLFNPFIRLAGWKALLIGLVVIIASALTGAISNTHFDGAIDIHIGARASMLFFISEAIISWLTIAVVLYLAGIILSKSSIRFIDVAGTTAIAKYPLFFASFLGFIPGLPGIFTMGMPAITIPLIIVGILSVICIVWEVVLLVNAYKISCNLQGLPLGLSFTGGIIVAEIISKIAVIYLFKQLL